MKTRVVVFGIDHNHCEAKVKEMLEHPDEFDVAGFFCESQDVYQRRAKNSSIYKNVRFVDSEDELFAIPNIDFVLVEPAVKNLMAFAKKVLKRNLSMHLDKPAGLDIDEWKNILQEAEDKKLIIQMGYMYRYNKGIEYALNKIKEGALGDIFHIYADMSTGLPKAFKENLRQYDIPAPLMYIYGIHLIDLIVSIMGKPLKIDTFNSKTGIDDISYQENNMAVFTYPKGTAVIKTFGSEVNGWENREFKVCGSKGTIKVSPVENKMVVQECYLLDSPKPWSPCGRVADIKEPNYRYLDQFRHLVKMLNGEKNPYSYEHELLVHRLTLIASGVIKDNE